MPTFQENIKTIETAIYGKEMRPAIKEALEQTKVDIENMITQVNDLNKRVDALKIPGEDPDNPDDPTNPDTPGGSCCIVGRFMLALNSAFTVKDIAGEADEL